MSELTKNINDIFGYILLYSVIIFTALSALLGGIVVYPVYGVIYIFNKIREHCCANEVEESAAQNSLVVLEFQKSKFSLDFLERLESKLSRLKESVSPASSFLVDQSGAQPRPSGPTRKSGEDSPSLVESPSTTLDGVQLSLSPVRASESASQRWM